MCIAFQRNTALVLRNASFLFSFKLINPGSRLGESSKSSLGTMCPECNKRTPILAKLQEPRAFSPFARPSSEDSEGPKSTFIARHAARALGFKACRAANRCPARLLHFWDTRKPPSLFSFAKGATAKKWPRISSGPGCRQGCQNKWQCTGLAPSLCLKRQA